MPKSKLMIIGLDAATLRLVEPMAAEGKLPNLAKFMAGAAVGELASTLPAASPASWSTFATGMNPGGHGIISFVQMPQDSYAPCFLNASNRRGRTFWEIAGEEGVRCGIMNVPVTYPPRPCNGFVVGCLLSPSVSPNMVSPPELLNDLLETSPHYVIDIDVAARPGRDVRELMLKRALEAVACRQRAAIGLYRKHRPDLFCVVFTEIDRICHYFWTAHEAWRSGRTAEGLETRLGQAIEAVYQRTDEAVGAVLAEVGDDTDVLIVSDHGAGPVRTGLNMRRALAAEGLFGEVRPSLGRRLFKRSLYLGVKMMPTRLRARIKSTLPGLSSKTAGLVVETGVDWRRTLAYPCGDSGGIFVNLRGRQPMGTVAQEDYETVRDRIIRALEVLVDPNTGRRVMRKVHRREEIWSGPCLERLPDVLAEQEEQTYDTPLALPTCASPDDLFYSLPPSLPTIRHRDGGHTRDGLIMAKGPDIKPGRIEGARMLDVAPTVMAMLGCAVPAHFEGKVLTQMLQQQIEVKSLDDSQSGGGGSATALSSAEQQAVADRLRGLGYI